MARTTTFKSVLHRVAIRMGLDPTVNLERNQAEAIGEYIRENYELAYEWYEWPEAECFEQVTALDQVIEWDDVDPLAGIGTVFCVSEGHPLKAANPVDIEFKIGPEGIYLPLKYASTEVWISYRPAAPKFTATEYNASTAYAVGDSTYYATTGECYLCTTASTGNLPTVTNYWQKLDLLKVLAAATVQGAYSETLAEEGQHNASVIIDSKMEGYLEHELDRLELQSGQTRHLRAR